MVILVLLWLFFLVGLVWVFYFCLVGGLLFMFVWFILWVFLSGGGGGDFFTIILTPKKEVRKDHLSACH